MPHVSTAEDSYMGYRIPKGALIVPNMWLVRTHSQSTETTPEFLLALGT